MKAYFAEAIGTFTLVFCGTGAIIINDLSGGNITHVGVALTFGLVVLAMIYTLGDVSGAHLNPAVSVGFWFARRFPASKVLPYITAQILGALAASATLKILFPSHPTFGATIPSGSLAQSFVLEIILTFFLMFVIVNVSVGAKEKGLTAGVAIAAMVGLEAMFAGQISGASMNPARSIAPAIDFGQNFGALDLHRCAACGRSSRRFGLPLRSADGLLHKFTGAMLNDETTFICLLHYLSRLVQNSFFA